MDEHTSGSFAAACACSSPGVGGGNAKTPFIGLPAWALGLAWGSTNRNGCTAGTKPFNGTKKRAPTRSGKRTGAILSVTRFAGQIRAALWPR